MTFLSTLPSTVPSSAFATALSLPIVTRVKKGQSVRVGKDGHKDSQHLPELSLMKEMGMESQDQLVPLAFLT